MIMNASREPTPMDGNSLVGHAADGNVTRNGNWYYAWDGENNMESAEPISATNGSISVENGYDYMKRRIRKNVSVLTGYEPPSGSPPMPGDPGEWVPVRTTQYVWDGWNIAAEITVDVSAGTTNVTRYVWGLDLSGSIQGAGGVGGLLAEIKQDGSVYFPAYDANGNISEYVDESGTVRAHRKYDAFGNKVAQSGDLVDSFRFWFSTKYHDEETGNDVYQQRQYIPPLARWASRDPIGERGGVNLCGFSGNDLINGFDSLGLWSIPKRDNQAWASVYACEGDTWNELAKQLGLDVRQVSKWVSNYPHFPRGVTTARRRIA